MNLYEQAFEKQRLEKTKRAMFKYGVHDRMTILNFTALSTKIRLKNLVRKVFNRDGLKNI